MEDRVWRVVAEVSGGRMDMVQLVFNGPRVCVGLTPGPEGVAVSGRGLSDRHAVITMSEDGSATIAPVGLNRVWLSADHLGRTDFRYNESLIGPASFSVGDHIHLGPAAPRGISMRVLRIEPLADGADGP